MAILKYYVIIQYADIMVLMKKKGKQAVNIMIL